MAEGPRTEMWDELPREGVVIKYTECAVDARECRVVWPVIKYFPGSYCRVIKVSHKVHISHTLLAMFLVVGDQTLATISAWG